MDDFPVRPLKFAVEGIGERDPIWSRTHPRFAMFLNAFSVHVPYFERYLIRSMTRAKAHISDPTLLRDITGIVGQEAHHAKNFVEFNRALARHYPKIAQHDADANRYFSERAKNDDLKTMVGFTAGYETFTFLGGAIILQNYKKWFADSDPVIKAMYVWHQVEEIEHGSVAFEVYQHLFGQHEWYRKRMVLGALLHIAKEAIKSCSHMSWIAGKKRSPFKWIKDMSFCIYFLSLFVINALPVFRKGYHPKRHPIANREQNPIQIAWRRYEKAGGNVLEIDHLKMAQILEVSTQE